MKNERSHMSGSKLTGQEISVYFRKNPKAGRDKTVKKAVEIALDHGGAMNFAIKEIEKLKRGLSKHPEVKKALDRANFGEGIARDTFKKIVNENYTKNFNLLCNSIKLNKIQQNILDDFIKHGTIKNQYVGRVAGTKKETKIFAAKKKYSGSIDNRNEALMKALKVNAQQRNILDSYLKTGKVIGKYTGSIAGQTKTTKSYAGFRGFKEHFESTPEPWQLEEGKQGLSSVNRDIEGNGGSLGGFSLNFDSSSDEKNALKAVEKFAKKNRIRDYGTYKYSGMGSAKGRTQVWIQSNKVDVSDLYREVGTKANMVGKSVAGMDYRGKINEAAAVAVVVDFDMGDPRDHEDDFNMEGVFLLDFDKRKKQMAVGGDPKDLEKWLSSRTGMGFSKAEAKDSMKGAVKVKPSMKLRNGVFK